MNMKISPLIYDFRVQLPSYHLPQEYSFHWLAAAHTEAEVIASGRMDLRSEWLDRMGRLIRRYGCSAQRIGGRRSELSDFMHTRWEEMSIFNLTAKPAGEGIDARNQYYADTANRVVNQFYAGEEDPPADLLHVTCTGYSSPSAIQRLIERKRWGVWTRATQIYHLGCYAALPALRVAAGLLFNPQNGGRPRADILHTELCSLHLNPRDHSPEQLVVQSLFADGHIRYSMTLDERLGGEAPRPAFEALAMREEVIPDSFDDMTWVLSEWGFRMTLSREAPDKIAVALPGFLERLLASAGEGPLAHRDEMIFAIHPGGPKIIDSVQKLFKLDDDQIAFSRAVLFERGNMSSATLPHIWAKILADAGVRPGTHVVSLAFGPGLTIAGALFKIR
ncbi:MAG TPA: 3-oxoacyl-[acyl-carrier-protein] synthase III C-terminal domain-containing protein [Blastocatellia bacterium]|nr:3-oxoacyl-[acyl-carrier-protein] synthase III C-terminal domain-containing protein [Blastocatellia bacterium]